jgi:hypothetical protein
MDLVRSARASGPVLNAARGSWIRDEAGSAAHGDGGRSGPGGLWLDKVWVDIRFSILKK